MAVLPGLWHAAARMSGRLDLSTLADALGAALTTAPSEALARGGLKPAQATALTSAPPLEVAHEHATLVDPRYPDRLRLIPYAPPVLFWQGDPRLLEGPAVAIVGTRAATQTGKDIAERLGAAAAGAGATVVSGLAYGVDAAAHTGGLKRTVAVLGQGLGVALQGSQRRLADRILDAGGLLVSEFPPDTPPAVWTFPQRNRVIAGLSQLTVVVEAAGRSGALITARYALEAGREVLAVPGSPHAPASEGCLELLAQGARICRGPPDLLRALGLRGPAPARVDDPLGVLRAAGRGATFDELLAATGADPVLLSRTLAGLELTGLLRRLPGERYSVVDTA